MDDSVSLLQGDVEGKQLQTQSRGHLDPLSCLEV